MKKGNSSALDWIAYILVVIGALNWGLVGIFNWNLVDAIFGGVPVIARIIYILVGLSGLWVIWWAARCCKCSDSGSSSNQSM